MWVTKCDEGEGSFMAPVRLIERYKEKVLLKGALGRGGEPFPGFVKTLPQTHTHTQRQVTSTPAHSDTHGHSHTNRITVMLPI